MTDPVYDKLAFNGFHVTFWNHESRIIQEQHFPTAAKVHARGFEEIPSAESFAEDLFDVYGDCVGKIVDNSGTVLYDNMQEMRDLEEEMSRW